LVFIFWVYVLMRLLLTNKDATPVVICQRNGAIATLNDELAAMRNSPGSPAPSLAGDLKQ